MDRLHQNKYLYLFRFTSVVTEGYQKHTASHAITDSIPLHAEGGSTAFIIHILSKAKDCTQLINKLESKIYLLLKLIKTQTEVRAQRIRL